MKDIVKAKKPPTSVVSAHYSPPATFPEDDLKDWEYVKLHPRTELNRNAFSYRKKLEFLKAYGDNTCDVAAGCKAANIDFSTYWAHYSPDEELHDPWFYNQILSRRTALGHRIERHLFSLAFVPQSNYFNYTIAALRALIPGTYERQNRLAIGIQNGKVLISYGGSTVNPLRISACQETVKVMPTDKQEACSMRQDSPNLRDEAKEVSQPSQTEIARPKRIMSESWKAKLRENIAKAREARKLKAVK